MGVGLEDGRAWAKQEERVWVAVGLRESVS